MKIKLASALLMTALFGVAAQAQMSLPSISPSYISSYTKTDVMSRHLQDIATRRPSNELAAPAAPRSSVASADFTFRNDRSRTRQNLNNFIERTPNAEAKADLRRMIDAQPNLIEEMGQAIRPYGLNPSDAADAYTLWWINSWLVANKRSDNPDRGTIAMVRNQVRAAFAATPEFMEASDAQRQEYAEAHLLQAAILNTAFEQWKSDPSMLDQLASAAKQGAKANGIDLNLMQLTANGFVPSGGGISAVDQSEEPAAMALGADTGAFESKGSLSVLLASAAGVSLIAFGVLAYRKRV